MRYNEFNTVEPQIGDVLGIELGDSLIETTIVDLRDDGIVVEFDLPAVDMLKTKLNEGVQKQLMWDDAERMDLEQFLDRYAHREQDREWVTEFWKDVNGEEDTVGEAKYQGREVPLGKPMAGDVKKSKVYVRGPKGNVVKVNFGDPNMKIKKSNPKRRKSFRARHNCANPGPRWKARYWSCRAW